MDEFERRLVRMVTEVEFREGGEIRSGFQARSSEDIEKPTKDLDNVDFLQSGNCLL